MDSGASFHMTPIREWFSTFQHGNWGAVALGDDRPCDIKGMGTVRIEMHDGVVRDLLNVRYVPHLKRNLISLGLMDTKDYSYSSKNGVLQDKKGDKVVM